MKKIGTAWVATMATPEELENETFIIKETDMDKEDECVSVFNSKGDFAGILIGYKIPPSYRSNEKDFVLQNARRAILKKTKSNCPEYKLDVYY